MPLDPKTRKEFEDWGVEVPTSDHHGTEEDIRAQLRPMMPRNWRMEGNMLIGDTDLGVFQQRMPTNVILTGTDAEGKPVFKTLEV